MKLVELHILQSFPVSCLNRDDVGSPKSAVFGGVTRARISSQCLKRAVRLCAKDMCPDLFKGDRSRLIINPIAAVVEKQGIPSEQALKAARTVCDKLASLDTKKQSEKKKKSQTKKQSQGVERVKTLMFLSPGEIEQVGEEIARLIKDGKELNNATKALKGVCLNDGADIAIFGRMVATDHSLTLEGSAMFSHALSTHAADNEIDFYTAVDDRQKEDPSIADEDRAGSGMMGILEYVSATYYRYVGLNVDLLWDEHHLKSMEAAERSAVIDSFLRAALIAVPSARHNSMNANTLPGYVLGVVKEKGYPLQLVNAFENPVKSGRGVLDDSITRMKDHYESLKQTWGIEAAWQGEIPPQNLNSFCKEIVERVC